MILLTDEETKSYKEQKVCHICKKEFITDKNDKKAFKLYHKVRDHCHYTGKFRGAALSICNLKYKTPKELSVVFHNGSSYDYHFIIKQLAKEFKGQFECLGEYTEKYITFSLPIKKELDNGKTITYEKLQIALDLCQPHYQAFVDNLSEIKKRKIKSESGFIGAKNNKLLYKCKKCQKRWSK